MNRLLGIESSCDDTALALFDAHTGIYFERLYNQKNLHSLYGGVVPELASREHLKHLPALIKDVPEAELKRLEGIAVTQGPGLAPALAIGLSCAGTLSLALNKPLYLVHHLVGHLSSPFLVLHKANPKTFKAEFQKYLPHLGLIVSGGHTVLALLSQTGTSILAECVDDAAGEAFDKGAKLLNLSYPGGSLIERDAKGGDSNAFAFPLGLSSAKDMRFSFSGLKTKLRYTLAALSPAKRASAHKDLCASYQKAIVAQLLLKTKQGLEANPSIKSLGLSGGVANNSALRAGFETLAKTSGKAACLVKPKYSSDNAAMIAFGAFLFPKYASFQQPGELLSFKASWPLTELLKTQ